MIRINNYVLRFLYVYFENKRTFIYKILTFYYPIDGDQDLIINVWLKKLIITYSIE